MDDLPRLVPDLAHRLNDATPTDSVKGSLSVSTRLRSVTGGAFVLIGDASGSADAITGQGLSMAFRQALALAEALANNQPMLYEAAHRHITRIPRLTARLLLAMDNRPALRGAVIRALAARPETFSRLLAVHMGALAALRGAAGRLGTSVVDAQFGAAPVRNHLGRRLCEQGLSAAG
jgi:2-polyprenyl-6-methoxyphenol hydroxylase-like FAD-dependent oxidoreductase